MSSTKRYNLHTHLYTNIVKISKINSELTQLQCAHFGGNIDLKTACALDSSTDLAVFLFLGHSSQVHIGVG